MPGNVGAWTRSVGATGKLADMTRVAPVLRSRRTVTLTGACRAHFTHETPAHCGRMEHMTRQLLIELPEELATSVENEAKRVSQPVAALVKDALVEYLGWRAIDEVRAANRDLDAEAAERMAYAELDQVRAERARG
jgi:predicted DNA-binding protein